MVGSDGYEISGFEKIDMSQFCFGSLSLIAVLGDYCVSLSRAEIKKRVSVVSESALYHKKYVSSLDVLLGIGWLEEAQVQNWRQGKVSYLERVVSTNLRKISYAMSCLRGWADKKGLKPSETAYLVKARGPKKALQFSKSGCRKIEKFYRTHYVSPALCDENKAKKDKRKKKRKQKKQTEIFSFEEFGFCPEEWWEIEAAAAAETEFEPVEVLYDESDYGDEDLPF